EKAAPLGLVAAARGGEKRRDLRLVEHLRQRPAEAGRVERRGRIVGPDSFREQELEELAQRREAARGRTRRHARGVEPGEISPKRRDVGTLDRRAAEKRGEVVEVGTVGGERP